MSPKNVGEELKIIERSIKRTTTSGCNYEISEKTAKKFIRLRQKADIETRLIMQTEINKFKENVFDKDATKDPMEVLVALFKPGDPSRELFNHFIFKMSSKPMDKIFFKKLEKLEKRKKKLNQKFQELAFREEFFFEKLTQQIVYRYKKTIKPYEFEILNLIFDFQNDLRLFNWNVVDKDPQVEFLFNIFKMLQIKQNLLEKDEQSFQFNDKKDIPNFLISNDDDKEPVLYELLYINSKLAMLKRRINRIEKQMFTGDFEKSFNLVKKWDQEKIKLFTKYIKQIRNLNKIINHYNTIVINYSENKSKDDKDKFILKLKANIDERIKPIIINDKGKLDDVYRNEFYLVDFIIGLFEKIFKLLMKKRTMSDFTVIKRLISEVIMRDKLKVGILLTVVFLNALIGMIFPLIFRDLLNVLNVTGGSSTPNLSDVYGYGWYFLLIAVLGLVFSIVSNWIVQYIGNKVMYDMRGKMFNNLQKLSFDYYNFQPSGKIISYITNDVETIQELISSGFLTVFIDVFRLIGSVALMLYISWQLTLTAFSIIPLILVGGFFVFQRARKYFVIMRRKIAAVTTHIQESVAGMRVIKSFAIEDKDYSTFKRATEEELEINLKAAKLLSALPGLMTVVITSGVGLLILVGGWQYIQFSLGLSTLSFEPGDLLAFLLYIFQFFGPIIAMMQFLTNIQNSMAAGARIIRLVDAEPSVKERENPIGKNDEKYENITKENIEIKFDSVNFEYEKGLPILKNINLVTKPGERLALVGYTGAGKSTFIKLLGRFWDVTSGRILINGNDIRNYGIKELRDLMGFVLQDNILFSGTVMDNIKYGKPDASDEQVFAITKKLGVHQFILNLEEGYQTPVRERGSRLSAGQKQLIAFARALLPDPPILVLDEATSAIDPYSEIIIKRALDILLKNRTSITIAHRLSTILNSDRILVIDDGRVVETGNHEELISQEGLYKHLYELQYTKIDKQNHMKK